MTVEVLQGLKRKLTLTINKNDVKILVDNEIKQYAKKAKIHGFRPGKAPMNIVEKMYGGQAYEDVLNSQVNKSFEQAINVNKLNLAGFPDFSLTSSEGDNFQFEATFEVMPEITFADLSNIEVEKPECELAEGQIEDFILKLRQQRAQYIDTDKAADNNDKVTIDFVGTIDGVEFSGGKANDYSFILGQKSMLPEFEAGVLGLAVNETREVEVNFPDNYHAEELKGKKALFNITLKKIAVEQLPELNEEFIKSVGVSDGQEDTLRKEILENINREIEHRINMKLTENVFDALYKANPIDVPHQLVHDEIHHMIDNAKENMKKQGYNLENLKLTHDMFKDNAKRMVTLRLLVQQLIKDNNITVTDNDVMDIVTRMSEVYDDQAQYISWYYEDQNRVANARSMALEKKLIQYLLTKLIVKNYKINYEDLMGQQTSMSSY